jgi:hypothetical protein
LRTPSKLFYIANTQIYLNLSFVYQDSNVSHWFLYPKDNKFDILAWWKVNSSRFLVLAQLARDVY